MSRDLSEQEFDDEPKTTPLTEADKLGDAEVAGDTTDNRRARIFPCDSCGADFEFSIGTQNLKCPFCAFEKEIELRDDAEIKEQDFRTMLDRAERHHEHDRHDEAGHQEVRCESCGGNVMFSGTLTSSECPYCASPMQLENVHSATHRIPVDGVLPFHIDRPRAHQLIREWVGSRWFAPNEFLKRGADGKFNGVYLPYWTFDSLTFNAYSGERGDSYTVWVGSGKNRRMETRIRWSPASGRFQRFFDDVLVVGVERLPRKYIQDLEPWPFEEMMPFNQQVLAGFLAHTYDVKLDDGFGLAKERIDAAIHSDVRQRIGGDHQRVHSIKSRYDAITFKHLLLPVWILVYRFKEKPYRVFINGGTGEVQGERPYSIWKIASLILFIVAVFATIMILKNR